MWKPEHRVAAERRGLRYESDLTDAEWALVGPLIRPAKRGGRPRRVNVREVLNAIFYVLWTGFQWKALPKDLPPRSTVWDYLESATEVRGTVRNFVCGRRFEHQARAGGATRGLADPRRDGLRGPWPKRSSR